jgi:hypothetical protein
LVFGEAGVQTQSVKANPAEIEEPLPPAEGEGGDVAPGEGSLTPAPAAPAAPTPAPATPAAGGN